MLERGQVIRSSLGGRDQETPRPQLSGDFWREVPRLWMCSSSPPPSSQTPASAASRTCKLNQGCASARQSKVSFVGPDISLVQDAPNFSFVIPKKMHL